MGSESIRQSRKKMKSWSTPDSFAVFETESRRGQDIEDNS